ncbi:MAG: 6,7-dimethyl-8-ribityllumazine synthase [Candidatus Nanopelagicaceae bacterium]|nr:6,7-dimethyl-8-ribityllumazine synthase [Candidatus Nanopelagicaceae bacterium]
MSGSAPKVEVPSFAGSKVAIISARWHQEICGALVAGAKRALNEAGVVGSETIYVPGSFELPLAAQFALNAGADAAVVLGVVLRGETPHFDYVCQGVTDGVMQVSLKLDKPIGFGVLTVDTVEQAVARSGVAGSKEDKGYDSAVAALDLLRVKRELSDRLRK